MDESLAERNWSVDQQNPVATQPTAIARPSVRKMRPPRILRFRKSERLVHWAIAIPFLGCFSTAIMLIVLQTIAPMSPIRPILSWTHRLSGCCLIFLPVIAVTRSRGDMLLHFYNIRQAWMWTFSDIKWLLMVGIASVNRKVSLPDQGKFNAGEKLNFMVLMSTYPFYAVTGLTIWLTHNAFLSWVVHFSIAAMGTPLVLGHIYMATINPESRKGLQGMISGFVDRQWAKHHYRRWYVENFESKETSGLIQAPAADGSPTAISVLCSRCREIFSTPPATELESILSTREPLHCPHCGSEIHRLSLIPDPNRLEVALRDVEDRGSAAQLLSRALDQCEAETREFQAADHYIGFPMEEDDADLGKIIRGTSGHEQLPAEG